MEILIHAWHHTIVLTPYLLLVYVFLELIERYFKRGIEQLARSSKNLGVVVGSVLGCIPQCGFSVIASLLFSQRAISRGTLLAVYLSTSDEALPVLFAHQEHASSILTILLIKLVIANIAGYSIDLIFPASPIAKQKFTANQKEMDASHCCGREHGSHEGWVTHFIVHPAWHTLRVLGFIFVINLALELLTEKVTAQNLSSVLLGDSFFQPFITAAIGLIPNCAASVAIIELFLKGGVSYGSMMAGLCASAGLALPVLFKEEKSKPEFFKILGLLFFLSVLSGIILNGLLR